MGDGVDGGECGVGLGIWGRGVGVQVWAMGCGLWAMGCGLWAVGYGLWAVGCGLWAVGYGGRCLGNLFSELPAELLETPRPLNPHELFGKITSSGGNVVGQWPARLSI